MKVRRKTVHDAIQFKGSNFAEVEDFLERGLNKVSDGIVVYTSDGNRFVRPGDWIIKEGDGKFSVQVPDEFGLNFERLGEPDFTADDFI